MKNWKILLWGMLYLPFAFSTTQFMDGVTAIVDNGVVLQSDVNQLMQSVKASATQAHQSLPDDAILRRQVMEQLIMDTILLQKAKNMGITITDDQLNHSIAEIAGQNHMTLPQLVARLNHDGLDYTSYREQIRKQMLIASVRNNEVRQRITILPQEVDTLAKQIAASQNNGMEVNLSHILISLPENPSQQQVDKAETLANQLITELKKGANFSKLAMTYSGDSQALKGGEMGWSHLEALPTLFADQVRPAHKGDIIGPIRSGVGFHILRVNDTRGQAPSVAVTEMHARHILLRTSPVMNNQQAQEKLLALTQQIKQGKTTFAEAAKQYSQDPGSADKGGDLGWSTPEVFDPAFRDVLLHLKPQQISPPIQTPYGWHIIELLGTRTVDKTDAAQKSQAYQLLFNRKFAEETQTWMQELRANSYVKIIQ